MNEELDAPDLRHYLAVVRRRKLAIVGVAAAVTFFAVLFSLLQTTQYKATSRLLLESQPADPLEQQLRGIDAQRALNNEVRQLESTQARDAVRQHYTGPLNVDGVSAAVASTDSDVIDVSVTAHVPADASDLVNTYVEQYIAFRRAQEVNDLLASGAEVRKKADELQVRINTLSAPLLDYDRQIAAQGANPDPRLVAARSQKAAELASQLDPLQSQLSFYQTQLDKVELSAGLKQAGLLRVLTPADVPSSPVSPKPVRNAALGIVLGLLLGIGVAFLLEYLDDSLKDMESLESATGLPTLGVIPRIGGKRGEALNEMVTVAEPKSVAAEAYRTLRTSVKFLGIENELKVVQITSPAAVEGKTLTSVNLAIALAQAGDRTILVGCDLRRPRLDQVVNLQPGPGLTAVLLGEVSLTDAVVAHPDVSRLSILRTGQPPPYPSELLGGKRTEALLQALAASYDIVVLDCPPVLPVTDSLVLARYADAVFVVARENVTSRRSVGRAVELLRQVDAPLAGTILNDAAGREAGYGYGGGYSYSYSYGRPGGLFRRRGRNNQAYAERTAQGADAATRARDTTNPAGASRAANGSGDRASGTHDDAVAPGAGEVEPSAGER